MDEFLDIPTLIVIGLAIVVLFRLRQVLGTRTGRERTPLERQREAAAAKGAEENVVQMRPRPVNPSNEDQERLQRRLETEITQLSNGDANIAEGLKAIAEADPSFSPKTFMEGAKAAYEMIVTAFASGDRQTLKNLLEKDVYDGFERVIREREAAGRTVDFTFVGLPKVDISEAELDKRNALVTIRFHAEVVSATRDKDGTLIEGNADQVTNIADEWTFARSTKSRDPNWKLVATSQLE
ncbi:Tim44/TimA family putative adaptor protein [Devosia sp. ZB163]|uniref:Tim44/TimA family putative adaptor protein n=1 Tax=Devosia sp. ZB163 TaxID=3025938 RepID=UPI002362624E|nr:Tim44/TimA family putative adaptor protein [Devosia sp. ZB163]MDC9822433.1 Tim44/TimA family putative adaptor protein [Devosia sp. ZB163]